MNIRLSEHFVMVESILLSRMYRPNVLGEKEWKLLFYLHAAVDHKRGSTYSGHKAFSQLCPCSKNEYKKLINRLEELRFVRVKAINKYLSGKFVLLAPLWDQQTRTTVSTVDKIKTGKTIGRHRRHFSQVPGEAIINAISSTILSVDSIRLLLKLYKYNVFKLFNGVDPNAVRWEDDKLIVHPRILFDLYIDAAEFEFLVTDLIDEGLLQKVPVEVIEEQFDHETRLRTVIGSQLGSGKTVTILQPVYQWLKEEIA